MRQQVRAPLTVPPRLAATEQSACCWRLSEAPAGCEGWAALAPSANPARMEPRERSDIEWSDERSERNEDEESRSAGLRR